MSLRGVRGRELGLWLVLLVCVLNFAPALFESAHLAAEPFWRKLLKDVPVVALVAAAWLVARRAEPVSGALHDRLRTLAVVVAVFAAVMLIDAALRRPEPLGLLVSLRYYVLYPVVAIAVWRLQLTSAEVRRFIVVVCILGAFETLAAVASTFNLFGDHFYSSYVYVGDDRLGRAIGTLGNPDNLGLFLALPVMLLIWARPFGTAPRLVLLCCTSLGLALTFSKAAVIALTSSVAIMLLRGAGRAATGKLLLLAGVTLGGLYLIILARFRGDWSRFSFLGDRDTTWPAAWERWTSSVQSFLVGDGYGVLARAKDDSTISDVVIDNMVLSIGVEGGLLGLLLLGLAAATALRIVLLAGRSPVSDALLAFALFFTLYTPFFGNFRLFPGSLLFWIVVGLAASEAQRRAVQAYQDAAAVSPPGRGSRDRRERGRPVPPSATDATARLDGPTA